MTFKSVELSEKLTGFAKIWAQLVLGIGPIYCELFSSGPGLRARSGTHSSSCCELDQQESMAKKCGASSSYVGSGLVLENVNYLKDRRLRQRPLPIVGRRTDPDVDNLQGLNLGPLVGRHRVQTKWPGEREQKIDILDKWFNFCHTMLIRAE